MEGTNYDKEWVAGSVVVVLTTTGEWETPAHLCVGGEGIR
jgi:hypothetical protein